MERQYVAVHTVGIPQDILEQIRQVVRTERRTRTIPAIKFDKLVSGRRTSQEFYYFLAVEGQRIDFLDLVHTILSRWNLRGNIMQELLTLDQIKTMVSGTGIETMGSFEFPYNPEWSNDADNLFDLSDALSNAETVIAPKLGDQYNQLLHWLSTTAEGTRQTVAKACDVLRLAVNVKQTKSIYRRLRLLGYIESSDNGLRWSICPTALVQCPTDQDVYYLTGQQTPMLIEQLMEHYEVELLPQPNYQGPSCVRVKGVFTDNVALNGFNIINVGIVSVQLAQLLPDLQGWKDGLPAIDRLSTTTYNIEIWDGKQYIRCDNFNERDGRYYGESGLYRLTKKAENNHYQIVLYFDEPNQRWLRGDWYGLRFLAYNSAGRQFEVKYDSSANELTIPIEGDLPLLYERALVLASGMLPVRDHNNTWLKYTNISNELVQLLAEKLNITIGEI